MQAAVQALISSLEPIFPEIAGMGVSSDGLIEAIHGCELRLVHAREAVLVSGVLSVNAVAVVNSASCRVLVTPAQNPVSLCVRVMAKRTCMEQWTIHGFSLASAACSIY